MWLPTSLGHRAISPATVQMASGIKTTIMIRMARRSARPAGRRRGCPYRQNGVPSRSPPSVDPLCPAGRAGRLRPPLGARTSDARPVGSRAPAVPAAHNLPRSGPRLVPELVDRWRRTARRIGRRRWVAAALALLVAVSRSVDWSAADVRADRSRTAAAEARPDGVPAGPTSAALSALPPPRPPPRRPSSARRPAGSQAGDRRARERRPSGPRSR